jgi:hypothetical protein
MLREKLQLFEVLDTEALCAHVIRRSGFQLGHYEFENCLTFLIETAWEYSLTYQPSVPPRFAVHLKGLLGRRLVDWQRTRNGRTKWQFADRTYERVLPTFTSLDDRPVEAVDPQSVDAGAYSDSVARRVLRTRDSEQAGHDVEVGEAAAADAA